MKKPNHIRAIISTIIPGATHLTEANFAAILAKKPPEIQKAFHVFLKLIRFAGLLRYGKIFENLDDHRQKKILSFFEKFPVGKIRLGFWGLRSLVLLSHYGDIAHSKSIGFSGASRENLPENNDETKDPFSAPSTKKENTSPLQLDFDIVIIGSGAGGGVMADRLIPLQKKGLKIAVLESGPNYQPKTYFNQNELQMTRLFWEDGGILNKEGTMTLAAARMVGGSTGVYTGVTFDLPETVFNTWNMDMDYSDFKKRMLKQREAFNTHVLKKEKINYNNRLFKKGAEACNMEVTDLEISTKNCRGTGFCNLGCVNDAKAATLNVQLPKAVDAGIEIIANCHVNTISEGEINAQIFSSPEGTKSGKYKAGDYKINAKQIIVAAGCYGTNALLTRSRLKKCSKNLGRNLTMHPIVTVYGKHPDLIEGFKNFPKAYYVGDFSNSEDHIIETAFYYPGVTAKNLEGWGSTHLQRMKAYAHLMCAIVLTHDKPKKESRIYWNGKRPVLDYRITNANLEALRMGQIRTAQLFFAAGCTEVYTPFAKDGAVKATDKNRLEEVISLAHYKVNKTVFASAHPQGGCGIGDENAVCDNRGRLRGYKNIYIADASLFPTSSHVNPALTVMALADVVADAVIGDFSNQT